jgi:uncharacterized membrane protein YcaP (DUF421 family)
MDLWRIAVRALVVYVFLLVLTRRSGKRVITQATPFDFIVALVVGDLIDDALWAEVSIAKFGAGASAIFLCDAVVKTIAFRWAAFYRLVNGAPAVVLRDGREDERAMRRQQMSEEELAGLLRLQGVADPSDVHLAILDRDHEISVILRPGAEPLQKKDAR